MLSKAISSALIMYALGAVIAALVVGLIKLVTYIIRKTATKDAAN